MTTTRLVAMVAMVGETLCAGQSAAVEKAIVTVCIDPDPQVLMGVRPLASKMFASIGVRIDWHDRDYARLGSALSRCACLTIRPAFANSKPWPLQSRMQESIVVFPDRVQELNRNGGPSVLAHVLVHEIAHVLEGIDRHLAPGIMKDKWDDSDYFEMRRKSLRFAQKDVDLIYDGLKVRQARLATAETAAVSSAVVAGQ